MLILLIWACFTKRDLTSSLSETLSENRMDKIMVNAEDTFGRTTTYIDQVDDFDSA